MSGWEAAFEAEVLAPLRGDAESVEIWNRNVFAEFNGITRRGHLRADDGWRSAAWNAFRYQRYHADAFRHALSGRYEPQVERVFFDFGCGAGAAAVALWEHLDEKAPELTVSYIGIDHNQFALDLGRRLFAHAGLVREHRLTAFVATLEQATALTTTAVHQGQQPFFTLSYVLNQHGLSSEVVDAYAAAVIRIVNQASTTAGSGVPLVITDLVGTPTWLPRLRDRLRAELTVTGDDVCVPFGIPRRFPNLRPDSEGWYKTPGSNGDHIGTWPILLRTL